jgi:hypothetical protein
MLSRKTRTMEFAQYTAEEFEKRLLAYNQGKLLLQDAFPELSNSGREFIKSGITDDEWDEYMGGNDDMS